MNKFGIFATMFLAAFAPIAVGCAQLHATNEPSQAVTFVEAGEPVDGMFFSTEFVEVHYEYDIDAPEGESSKVGAVVYDCPDANLYGAEILIDWSDYIELHYHLGRGEEVCGHLQRMYELSDGTPVFYLNCDMN